VQRFVSVGNGSAPRRPSAVGLTAPDGHGYPPRMLFVRPTLLSLPALLLAPGRGRMLPVLGA